MMATMLAIVDPGDEVIVFEPFYENYGPDAILSGATPRFVRLREPARPATTGRSIPHELAAAFSNRTRAIIINTPNNPDRQGVHARRARRRSRGCASSGARSPSPTRSTSTSSTTAPTHVPMATLDGMADRTVTINSVSKTFSVTGWRVGWTIAPPDITGAIRKVHDFLTVGAAAPLQAAAAVALGAARRLLRATWPRPIAPKRDRLMGILQRRRLRLLRAARRVLHHDGHRGRSDFPTTWRSRGTW